MNVLIVRKILEIPKCFHDLKDKSAYSLLVESGYLEVYDQISEREILKELVTNPSYIDYWLEWSDNKRVDRGWFFLKNDDGKYTVGYYPISAKIDFLEYNEADKACSVFVKKEIEDMRNSILI